MKLARKNSGKTNSFIIILLFLLLTGLLLANSGLSEAKTIADKNIVAGALVIKFKKTSFKSIKRKIKKNKDGVITTGVSSIDALNRKYKVKDMLCFDFLETMNPEEDEIGITRTFKLSFEQGSMTKASLKEMTKASRKAYKNNSNIEEAEFDVYATPCITPNDPGFPSTGNPYYFLGQWGLQKIYAPNAWDLETGSTTQTIAIVDTGIDYTHPDLSDKVTLGYDYGNSDYDPMDYDGHGTFVAGIASAITNNFEGIAGVSWNSRLLAVKVSDDNGIIETFDEAQGIYYAANSGAKVINISIGGPDNYYLYDACAYAYYIKGCALVAAMGNSYDNTVFYPAAYDDCVFAVGATDINDIKTDFSTWGPHIDVVAPGRNILSTLAPLSARALELGSPGSYYALEGTSFAAPFVSGLASLIYSLKPYLLSYTVYNIIATTCDDVNSIGFDDYTGNGRINAWSALNTASNY